MARTRTSALDAHLDSVRAAPADRGRVELLVRRPAVDQREVLAEAVVDPELGLVGDSWLARGNPTRPDGSADRAVQLTLINIRVLAAFEPDRSRWPLAGDQVYVDLDLSVDGLPAGSRLEIGSALIEASPRPHTGCAKFSARFGSEALRWINSPAGRACRMRGLNARVIRGGTIRPGDEIRRA
jgi:MOSC domain-containing protein YiiM